MAAATNAPAAIACFRLELASRSNNCRRRRKGSRKVCAVVVATAASKSSQPSKPSRSASAFRVWAMAACRSQPVSSATSSWSKASAAAADGTSSRKQTAQSMPERTAHSASGRPLQLLNSNSLRPWQAAAAKSPSSDCPSSWLPSPRCSRPPLGPALLCPRKRTASQPVLSLSDALNAAGVKARPRSTVRRMRPLRCCACTRSTSSSRLRPCSEPTSNKTRGLRARTGAELLEEGPSPSSRQIGRCRASDSQGRELKAASTPTSFTVKGTAGKSARSPISGCQAELSSHFCRLWRNCSL